MKPRRRLVPVVGLVVLICGIAAPSTAQTPADPVLDAPGFREHRDYFSEMPFENIDALTGSLVLKFTDLVLPANAGRELRFVRTYNSKGGRGWTFGIEGIPLHISNPPEPPLGPSHPQDATPALLMADGSVRTMAWHTFPNKAISSDFQLFDRTGTLRRLYFPNGDTCDYVDDSQYLLHVSGCKDVYNNQTDFEWFLGDAPPTLRITQHLGSDERTITVSFPDGANPGLMYPTKLAFDAGSNVREWSYSVSDVSPPGGGTGWHFDYDQGRLIRVTTPHGGEISYDYEALPYEGPDPQTQYQTDVVKTRSTGGRGITPGTWQYSYEISTEGVSGRTTILTPSTRIKYLHGSSAAPVSLFDGTAGTWPLISRTIEGCVANCDDAESSRTYVTLESDERTYTFVPSLAGNLLGSLELSGRLITRFDANGTPTTYSTVLNYANATDFGHFHNAHEIVESGPAGSRMTQRTFTSPSSSPYIPVLPASETVNVAGESATKSWTYETSSGFKTSETIDDITTQFHRDTHGNVASVTKANGKTTTFKYQYGQPSVITTPEYVVTRTIYSDGNVASEARAGRVTAFAYDDLGRLTTTQPPGATNPIIIDYDTAGEWVRTMRGPSQITVSLDGFGQKISTVNAVGVRQNTLYDAEGRAVREGYPFRSGDLSGGMDIWTEIEYDGLGRVVKRTNPDGTVALRVYGAGGMVVTAEQLSAQSIRSTTQIWQAFGSPDGARLASVIDADNHTWTYTYNVLGKLRTVSLDGTLVRQWTYNSHGLLATEVHPESGTTGYPTYDAAGMLVEKVDAKGNHTYFTYDGNDRVRTITAANRLTTITYEPGTDNRASAVNGSDGVIWRYDLATGRLQSRQDAVDGKLFTTAYEYDANDHLSALQYPAGRRIQYVVNAEGQTTRVYEAAANRNHATTITYHASGGVASYSSSNGITTTIDYDGARYWTTGITAGSLALGYGNYDYVGNPRSVTATSGGNSFSQTLTYDALDRLSGAASTDGASTTSSTYTYDAHGNRFDPNHYQYESGTLRLSNQDGVLFSYDNNGNALTIGGATFTYTPQNLVETVANLGNTATYAYDADDERVKKTAGSSTTYYLRGLSGELLTEWQDPGTATGRIRDYVYLGSRLLSAVSRSSTENPLDPSQPNTASHRYATSWQVPAGSGGRALLQLGASVAARKSSHPDMPRTGLRLGVQDSASTVDIIGVGPTLNGSYNPAGWKQGGASLEFEVERYPTAVNAEWLSTSGGVNSTDDLRLYVTPAGQLVLKHDDGRATPQTLWTSAPVGTDTPHTLELRFEYNSIATQPLPNPSWDLTSWAQLYYDGALVATYGAAPGSGWVSGETSPIGLDRTNGTAGLSAINLQSAAGTGLLMNVWRVGETAVQNHGDTLGGYGNAWRTTLLESSGPGAYSQWSGGQSDWRARSAIAGTGGFENPVTTSTGGQKISYKIESMLARGITGHIGTVLVGVKMQYVGTDARAFVRRNGVDTILNDFVLSGSTSNFVWYRVAQGGWSPTDNIEIGVTSGSGGVGLNYLQSVALIVEHDTPEPEPLTDTSARVVTLSYAGNGSAQTIDLGVDLVPTALFVMPINGVGGVEPIWWWDSRQGAAAMTQSVTNFARVWPQKGKLHVVHTASRSYNAIGLNYTVIAIFDPSGRYIIPFAASKPSAEDNYTYKLRYPQSGALAADFTPDFVFGGAAFSHQSDVVRASLYKGPGHVGDLTATLGTTLAPDADRIQAIGTGTVEFGKLIGHGQGDHAFWAGRVNDGVSPTRLMAVTSYVGNGTASRNIALDLNGKAPVFTLVVPTNATAKGYRVSGDSSGRRTDSGNALPNSITAMGANQITVGTALNANGVTYDVWAITTGFVEPQ